MRESVLTSGRGAIRRREFGVGVQTVVAGVRVFKLLRGIMRNKILGEDAVRALYFDRDGQYYTVVRPGGLSEDPAQVRARRAQPGSEVSGRVSRDDVAAICVESITREDTKNATFECYDADTAKPLGEVGFSNMMKATDADGVPRTGLEVEAKRGTTSSPA